VGNISTTDSSVSFHFACLFGASAIATNRSGARVESRESGCDNVRKSQAPKNISLSAVGQKLKKIITTSTFALPQSGPLFSADWDL
jgi:hypothetical protein